MCAYSQLIEKAANGEIKQKFRDTEDKCLERENMKECNLYYHAIRFIKFFHLLNIF